MTRWLLRAPVVAMALVLGACASTSDGPRSRVLVDRTELWPELAEPGATRDPGGAFPVRRPTPEQFEELAAAERAWRARDEATWTAAVERLSADEITAFWLSRMLIRDALIARRSVDPDVGSIVGEPKWERPIRALVEMGDAAAPAVALDLLCDPGVDHRKLGSEILARMGPEHLAAWDRVLDVDDPRVRRTAIGTIAEWGPQPRTESTLSKGIQDEEFGVRAAAWKAFGKGGPEDAARLRRALEVEPDPFVRRAIVEALSEYDDRESAAAIVAELERALRTRDARLIETCQLALRKVSGHDRDESLGYWQNWLTTGLPSSN